MDMVDEAVVVRYRCFLRVPLLPARIRGDLK